MNKIGSDIERFAAAAPAVWDYLAAAETVGGVPLRDVEFKRAPSGMLRVQVTLYTGDAPVPVMIAGLRAIAVAAATRLETHGPYRTDAQPSGTQHSAHVRLEIDGAHIDIQGLFDGEQYAAALDDEQPAGVPA